MNLVIDTNSMFTRAFYTNDLSFFSMIDRLKKEYNATYLYFAFDSGTSWRKTIYEDYKANRADDPNRKRRIEALRRLYRALKSAGFPVVHSDGFEADDVVGTLIKQVDNPCMVSGDKDFYQLTDQAPLCYVAGSFNNRKHIDANECVALTGLKPNQIVIFKALAGEKTDNIPGVPKIGKVRAIELIKAYDSFSEMQLDPRVSEHQALFDISLTLATIRQDVPINVTNAVGNLKQAQERYIHLRKAEMSTQTDLWSIENSHLTQ